MNMGKTENLHNEQYFFSFSWGYYYNAGDFVVQWNSTEES